MTSPQSDQWSEISIQDSLNLLELDGVEVEDEVLPNAQEAVACPEPP